MSSLIKEYSKLNGNKIEELGIWCEFYLMTCGFLTKKDVDTICKYYNIKAGEKEKSKYISDVNDKEIENFLELKKDVEIRKFTEQDMASYSLLTLKLIDEISKITKNEEVAQNIITAQACFAIFNDDEACDKFLSEINITGKKAEKLKKLMEDYLPDIRYWGLGGRTLVETELDDIVDDMLMKSVPEKNSLINCIKKLSDKARSSLSVRYMLNNPTDNDLKNSIINDFEEWITISSVDYYDYLISCHNKEIDYDFESDDFLSGFIYPYKENGKVKSYLPKEIENILKKTNRGLLATSDEGEPDNDTDFQNIDSLENIVLGYMTMNGVIEKEILVKLLKDYHNIDITIKKLDNVIKKYDVEIYQNKYYYLPIIEEEIDDIIKSKVNNNQYKKYSFDIELLDSVFIENVFRFFEENRINEGEEVKHIIIFLCKMGMIIPEIIDNVVEEYHITKVQKNRILDLIKPYKNKLSIWSLNGKSINDTISLEKSTKIGRNELCPCGSGKKYKQCHGK